MKGPWKITSQMIGDTRKYAIYRLLDTNMVDHSGNREYVGDYVDDRKTLEIMVDLLNEKERR